MFASCGGCDHNTFESGEGGGPGLARVAARAGAAARVPIVTTGVAMETSQTRSRLRSSTLWVPGVLIVVLGASIHTQVASLRGRARQLAGHTIACALPIDLSGPTIQEADFVPTASRGFSLRLVLQAAATADDAIAQALETDTFELAWRLTGDGPGRRQGLIGRQDLYVRTKADGIRYVFGRQAEPLKAGRTYKLVAEVVGASASLAGFSPTLLVETSSPLKGHPLARWRPQDTALLLFLGGALIALGLSKRRSDRKARQLALARPITASAGRMPDETP